MTLESAGRVFSMVLAGRSPQYFGRKLDVGVEAIALVGC
ncbi:hypothetical protein TNCV_1289081, partial [Trichonephila clavipes]